MSRRELAAVGLLLVVGFALRLVVTLATKNALMGDEPEYHSTGVLFTQGHPFWGTAPFGQPHASLWKAPLYGLWIGVNYFVLGKSPVRVEAVQALVGTTAILVTWLLARRLVGRGVALVAAAIVTVYPFAWQFGSELYPEALAVPLVTLTLWAFLARKPTLRRAVGVGALLGANLLLRPSSIFLLVGVAAAFIVATGLRRGLGMTAIAAIVAALVVSPWTIRNAIVADAFVPISVQDSSIYGTFNRYSAADHEHPYYWRAITPYTARIVDERPRPTEVELRRRLYNKALDYIGQHPASVPKALFWNGITRFWDLQSPSNVVNVVRAQGGNTTLAGIGLVMYWMLLPLAAAGLILLRGRKEILVPVLAMAAAASIVYTVDAWTRYRAPLEPLIVILACAPFARRLDAFAARAIPGAGRTPASRQAAQPSPR